MNQRNNKFLLAMATGLAIFGSKVHAEYQTDAWNHTGAFSTSVTASTDNSSFMKAIDGDTRINSLSLVGTHDSAASTGGSIAFTSTIIGAPVGCAVGVALAPVTFGYSMVLCIIGAFSGAVVQDAVRTQTMPLTEQMKAGIRFFDIRVKHRNDKFQLYHGKSDLGADMDGVLSQIKEFLKNNPSEVIMARIRNEEDGESNTSVNSASGNTRNFKETMLGYVQKYDENLFWDGKLGGSNPTLSSVRAKIIIFSDFGEFKYGLPYGAETANIEDSYHLYWNWDLYDKWEKIKKHLVTTNSQTVFAKPSIGYLSGSGGSFPYFVAGGRIYANTSADHLLTKETETSTGINRNKWPDFPRGSCTWVAGWICSIFFAGTNELTATWLAKNNPKNVGILVADFPGSDLIDRVIRINAQFKKMEQLAGQEWVSLSFNGVDQECASNDGVNCFRGASRDEAKKATTVLVCGEAHRAKYGITGYGDKSHWCSKARDAVTTQPPVPRPSRSTKAGLDRSALKGLAELL
ncbi:phosphatidylinositol-specific phospholipase C domain-containing protein [Verminephrobacter aporrectodeae subsp. tuberculatae]|uniref:phosphatidylinositol-specific phospholipase C n=1 Tax=Verminephrobacter aporrectodeae TaxID=1110389 RepID=UPI002244C6D5|nr:phosphatidylinositol-specific phospholipase C [Verminephrobacter aporrectodeae]MCW8166313.1 phosphatidylinositol-specific phospholipase C domain-containing protein [Verminephrobacter aporrectodeae subsp. tuberculatae]MCW8167948.1 phosphatidylinositol-specific phospholipase C domain-containing protein [Verminephrobacter aporrectodeae subsp. tuberculatae]